MGLETVTTWRDLVATNPLDGDPESQGAAHLRRIKTAVKAKAGETFSVKDFGAVGDGSTNDRVALQAAITYASANAVPLHIPAGRYYVPNNGTALSFTGSLTLRGDGMKDSVLVYDDDLSGSRNDFFTSSAAVDIDFQDVGFESSWGNDGTYTQRSQLIQITFSGSAKVHRCRFSKARYMALILVGGNDAEVTECEFYRTVADGCRIIDVKRSIVTGNKFKDVNDDAIAIHTLDATAAPLDNTAVVTSNEIVDSQGIAVLGSKRVVISDNTLLRPHTRAITVGPSSTASGTEGNTAPVSLSITGNIITDLINGSIFAPGVIGAGNFWIYLTNFAPTTVGGHYVGESDGAAIVQPWPYFYTNNIDGSAPNPGAWFIDISNNICARTLIAAASYSTYGYGTRYGRVGPADPAVTQANLTGVQVLVLESARNCRIAGNVLHGGSEGVYLDGTASSAYRSWVNVQIDGNVISNITGTAAIHTVGTGTVRITGNTIDGDPYCVSSFRGAGGTWGASFGSFAGVWLDTTVGFIGQNTFRNLGSIFKGSTYDAHWWDNNTICCKPVALGYSSSNVGIGDIGSPERVGIVVVEEGDPASANYGHVLNTCIRSSTAMPSTGTYVRGHYTSNAQPALAGGKVTVGWARLTTGSAHVLNTDWAALVVPNA